VCSRSDGSHDLYLIGLMTSGVVADTTTPHVIILASHKRLARDQEVAGSNPVNPTISQTQIPPLVAEATGDGI
jgi:hypothetical protein